MSDGTPQPRSYPPQGAVTEAQPASAADSEASAGASSGSRSGAADAVSSAFRSALRAVSATGAPKRDEHAVADQRNSSLGAPRRVRLSLSRLDPWSVMKLGFLLAVAIGIMTVVAAAVLWFVLDGMHVFSSINSTVTEVVGDESFINVLDYVEFGRVMSIATLVAVVNVVLLTALATIGAFLYNIVASLVGGVHVTLTDE